MNCIRGVFALSLLGVILNGALAQEKSAATKFDMIPIKYDGLKAEVLKYRGKVLVVDFWAGY